MSRPPARRLLKSALRGVGWLGSRLGRHALSPYQGKRRDFASAANQTLQLLLAQQYREAAAAGRGLPGFHDVELRCFSQNGEDGILLYLFALAGTTNRRVLEMCAGDGIECNAANLIVNHGWEGLLLDGDAPSIARGRAFYRECPDTALVPPHLLHAWITAENVNQLVSDHGFAGEIDLLSLDLDGVDYWIWKALDCVSARVVVLEYSNFWGPEELMTVRYAPDHRSSAPGGASLAAFVSLARQKGYRLVGAHRHGFNAFFVRDDVAPALLPEVSVSSCLDNPFTRVVLQRHAQLDRSQWIKLV